MTEETICTPWSATRQRRYDELAAQICDGPVTPGVGMWSLHQQVMARLNAECEELRRAAAKVNGITDKAIELAAERSAKLDLERSRWSFVYNNRICPDCAVPIKMTFFTYSMKCPQCRKTWAMPAY